MNGTHDLSVRLDLRRKTRRRTHARRLVIVAAIVAALLGLGWLIWFSPVLEVHEVKVEGNTLLTTDQVLTTAAVPIGTPLARVPAGEIADRVKQLPAVAEVDIDRAWPNGLVITVTERTRVFQRLDAGSYQWVDAGGLIFHATPERQDGVVAVTGSGEERLLADVAAVVQALPADVLALVGHMEAPTVDRIVVLLTDGRQIIWGNAAQSSEKAALLGPLLAMPGTVFDVTVPSHPAVS